MDSCWLPTTWRMGPFPTSKNHSNKSGKIVSTVYVQSMTWSLLFLLFISIRFILNNEIHQNTSLFDTYL